MIQINARMAGLAGLAMVIVTAFLMGAGPNTPKKADVDGLQYRGTLLVQMRVSDLDRAVKFYQEILGFEVRLRSDSLQWAELTFGIQGVAVGLGSGSEVKGSGSVSLNIGVKDVDAARTLLEGKGVVFAGDTMVIPDKVKLAEFSDPDGNRIRLAEALGSAKGE